MRLVHRRGPPDAREERTLATSVEFADTTLQQARGLMFRRSIPDDYALVFQFDRPETRTLHMLFVPFPIDAVWLTGPEVVRVERLRPWIGFARATADTVIELPAGAAADVSPGDTVDLLEENAE
ncbi:hypothetical protein AArcSl_2192 [Halalkaliarchaeum desulfuricum]|uniref:DUF192 domain-containing protein n=1 Tax=Halalkaliarchaeum desulfuricum TaxID=2055893 RepID=A0A343TL45_9EURY|nr:DUF192 domain-containing protein [Halalkaliarchaeum desulfuricum]AUX09817.1 hypothetical protein AArcSl_2192 [Halalkaliarchaeum desulfuricum]